MMNGIEYLGGGSGGGGGNVDDVLVNGISVVNENKEAEIVSYKEVTQSEYEALPDTKLTDGIAYFIKDSTEAEGYPPLIFSTSEREVGVWIDGKPLYEKTIQFSSNLSSSDIYNHQHGISNIDLVTDLFGFGYTQSGNTYPINNGRNGNLLGAWANSTYVSLYIGNNDLWSSDWTITLCYTKTTDTAGQGLWAGNGAMAHHYSTDEVIVGTWIDGKPVYEKSWEFDSYIIVSANGITSFASKGVVLSDINFFTNAILISKVDKRVYNTFAVGYFSGSIGVYNPLNADAAIDKIILQYTKTTD